MDIKIHNTSHQSHEHKAAVCKFKTPPQAVHNDEDNTRNINKTYYLGGGGGA
jgi:hypothetical protein